MYHPVHCNSCSCKRAMAVSCVDCYRPCRPGCTNQTCGVVAENPLVSTVTVGVSLGEDVVAVPSIIDGSSPAALAFILRFPITCGATYLLEGLPKGVNGILGLARTETALHTTHIQLIAHKFALCMPSSTAAKGVMIFGNGPYIFSPTHDDLPKSLMYTPLLVNPVSTSPVYSEAGPFVEHFIGVNPSESMALPSP
ncbi:hypothetical protein NE237_031266 [Protea cynaroides]|uniref:Xylanase inhibitor N-terminal domain-containing protein n=1 Tax=Protea cynaroides TaxID=273540 RepID=A0A9Q0R2A4_9MAGN|nr:hypothetical protein NE237_031266 [Protea cynaroides]